MLIHKLLHKPDKSLRMSAPRSYELHGVTIRKLPIGKYIQVLRALDDIPATVFETAFPEAGSVPDLIAALSAMDREGTVKLLTRLMGVVPEQLCRLLSELLDIPLPLLLSPDDGLSLADLAEILEAFWIANDMTGFFETVRHLIQRADKANTGSSAGLPSGKVSV